MFALTTCLRNLSKANQMKDRDRIYDYIVYAFSIVAGVCIIVGIVMAIIS